MKAKYPNGLDLIDMNAKTTPDLPVNDAGDRKDESADGLLEAARDEQEFLRERLRAELKREPSEEELNEYVRQHTESY